MQSAVIGGDGLMVVWARAEKIAAFVVASTELCRRSDALEPAHRSVSAFDAPVVLLKPIIEIPAGPVADVPAQFSANRPWVAVVPVRGHPVRGNAGDHLGRVEERLGGRVV